MRNAGRRLFIGSVATILVTACMGFARADKPRTRTVNIDFANKMMLRNGQTLPEGTYRVEVPEDTKNPVVKFERHGKVIATAHANVVSQAKKNEQTTVNSIKRGQAQLITEIRPGGWDETLVFGTKK